MKKAAPVLCLFILMTLLWGCQTGLAAGSGLSDQSASTPDPVEEETESLYQLNRPLLEAEGLLQVEPIPLPAEIRNMKTTVFHVLDESRFLVILYEKDPFP